MKLWEVRQNLTAGVSAKSYLYKIIDNLSLNLLKHQKVIQLHLHFLMATSSEGKSQTTFDSIELKELRETIHASISELHEQMRRIFELSRFEGLKYVAIADQLNISVKTVETQMSRALAKLRERLCGYLIALLLFIINY